MTRTLRNISTKAVLGLVLLLLNSCILSSERESSTGDGNKKIENKTLSIAAAANLRYVLDELKQQYLSTHSGLDIQVSYGSSGTLTQQILNGAAFHLFLSADTDFPEKIEAGGLSAGAPIIYCYGRIALWSMKIDVSKGLSSLHDPGVRKIAIANPALAPYGKNTVSALRQAGIYESVESKIVWGENISQAAQFVSSGNAELGFVALSTLLVPEMENKGNYYVLAESEPIAQGAVVLETGNEEIAFDFLDFLLSNEAEPIWKKFGYNPAESSSSITESNG